MSASSSSVLFAGLCALSSASVPGVSWVFLGGLSARRASLARRLASGLGFRLRVLHCGPGVVVLGVGFASVPWWLLPSV